MSQHEQTLAERSLSWSQGLILATAAVPMVVVGAFGGWGTYTNIKTKFPEDATALGVVAAGEGATLVLGLVMVGLTLLGQSSPTVVRLGLWTLPAIASGTGAVVASGTKEAVVYAITPMAMCAAAEGVCLLARRIVVYRTGVDMEARRRNAATMQRMAVLRAVAANHPEEKAREKAELASWRLARKVGIGDDDLGTGLVTVQRERLTEGADTALAGMFTPAAVTPALNEPVTPALEVGAGSDASVTPAVTDSGPRHTGGTAEEGAVTQAVAQVRPVRNDAPSQAAGTVTEGDRDGVAGSVTDGTVTDGTVEPVTERVVTLSEVAAVTGVPVPEPGERLSDGQLMVVLRHLRYRVDPPMSYRQAVTAFRRAGFVGGEERIRRTWGELMSHEEAESDTEAEATEGADSSHIDEAAKADEEDEEEAGPRP